MCIRDRYHTELVDLLYQLGVIQFRIIFHIIRDISNADVITLIIIIDVSLHLEQIDDSLEIILFSDRQLQTDLSLIHILPRWYISESDYQRTCSDYLSGLFLLPFQHSSLSSPDPVTAFSLSRRFAIFLC